MASDDLASLAQRAVNGDVRALSELLEELAPLVVRTSRLVVGPGSTAAEEAAQDALADLTRGIGTLRDPSAVIAWAGRIAARRALRAARFERLRRQRETELGSRVAVEDVADRRTALAIAFDQLPRRQRAVAVLRLYLGLTEEETAAALGISVGAVKSQLHAARRRLSASLEQAGFAPSVQPVTTTEGTP
jgi:RNA polymerase sigma-70 factor (ECF subfamily)